MTNSSPANEGKSFIVVLMPAKDERWQSFGTFDAQPEAVAWAKANYQAGDKRRWICIPVDEPGLYSAPAELPGRMGTGNVLDDDAETLDFADERDPLAERDAVSMALAEHTAPALAAIEQASQPGLAEDTLAYIDRSTSENRPL